MCRRSAVKRSGERRVPDGDPPRHGHQVWDDSSRAGERDEKRARIPPRRFGEPEDGAETVGFLASSAAGYSTGVSLPLDGGLLVAP